MGAIGSAFVSLGAVLAQWCGIAQEDMESVNWSSTGTAIVNKIFSDASAGVTQFNAFLSNLFAQASIDLSNTLDG